VLDRPANLCPKVATMLGELVLSPAAVLGTLVLGVPEGLVNLCPAVVTVLSVPGLDVIEPANLGPCPEVVITVLVTLDGKLVRGVDSL